MNKILYVNKSDKEAFQSISEAIGYANGFWGLPVEIKVAAGTYYETLYINQPYINLVGDSSAETIISNGFSALEILSDGIKRGTFRTATVRVEGLDFIAQNLTIINSAGSGEKAGQCIALYVDSEKSTFNNCHLLGHQDTLFLAPLPLEVKETGGFKGPGENRARVMGQHYFKDCHIEGDVDFIYGGAQALFDNCEIYSLSKDTNINGYITAPCTPENEKAGFVFFQCKFKSNCKNETVYIGRPWRNFAQTVLIKCELDSHIHRSGFDDWNKKDSWETCLFGEYESIGSGANPNRRSSFTKQISRTKANEILKLWNYPLMNV